MRIAQLLVAAVAIAMATAAALALAERDLGAALAFGFGALVLAGSTLATRGPRPHTAWSEDLLRDGRAVVFWKVGCAYCHHLIRQCGADPRISWVNVRRDRAADLRVRELNDGDQLTPTVIVGSRVLRNPSAAELFAVLDEADRT